MSKARDAVKRALSKTAAFAPPSSNEAPVGGAPKRVIPKGHPYDPRSLKPMSKALWAASMALGHTLAAYREMARLKSVTVSPDGCMGGQGYVMAVKDMRQRLFDASESLSSIADTLYDEINAPHWQPKLALLDDNDQEDVERFVDKSQDILEDPVGEASEDMREIEEENDDPQSSEVPSGESSEESVAQSPNVKEASASSKTIWNVTANSSVPVHSLGGPRVDHIGPAEGSGPWGSYNKDEFKVDDPWQRDEGGSGRRDESGEDYDYPSEWENDLRRAESAVPDSSTEDTETDAWDFGLGYGARGQGAGGYENPSSDGKGVWGPATTLPGTPSQSVGDATPYVDMQINTRNALLDDLAGPPARTDYSPDLKDNLVQGESELPSQEAAPWDEHHSLVDTGYVHEDTSTPYVRYDYTTRNNRPEHQHGREEELPWAHDTQ